jgi:hypothetical protein
VRPWHWAGSCEVGLFPLDMANDAAISDRDRIDASLAKVEEAGAYVALIGSLYGKTPEDAIRNPNELSLTELEFRRAVGRGIPTCVFAMSPSDLHITFVRAYLATANANIRAAQAKLPTFIGYAKMARICVEWESVEDLEAKAIQALANLRQILEKPSPTRQALLSETDSAILGGPQWYVSYAWGDKLTPEGLARDKIVDRLCTAAEARGYKILRDKDVLGLCESISDFMARIATGDRVGWVKYWKQEHDLLDREAREHGAAILGEHGFRRLRQMQGFYTRVADILGTLADIVQPRSIQDLERWGFDDRRA